jgi:glutathione synthase/RimK-type ligase-like ATP-grasp enzyme
VLIGIHNTWPHKPDPISDVYRNILQANDIDYIDINSNLPDFWDKIKRVDYFIYRWAHTDYHHQHAKTILPIIEIFYRIPCFPNWSTCWHYDDKVKQYLLLDASNFPVSKSHLFWDRQAALKWINDEADFPLVFKLKSGSGSMQVKLIKNKRQAFKVTKKMFDWGIPVDYSGLLNTLKIKNYNFIVTGKIMLKYLYYRYLPNKFKPFWNKQKGYVYFQEFHPDNSYDTRVQITGKRAYAYVRYNRDNDFRASGSNNWSLRHDKINKEFIRIAFRISKELGFQSMAYDFLYDKDKKPVIVEISYCYGDYPEFSNGFWDENLKWHEGRFLPQYFELVDLIDKKDLELPDWVGPSSSYIKVKVDG